MFSALNVQLRAKIMGMWNYGVFENDAACDVLGNLISELEEVVEEGLRLTKVSEGERGFARDSAEIIQTTSSAQ